MAVFQSFFNIPGQCILNPHERFFFWKSQLYTYLTYHGSKQLPYLFLSYFHSRKVCLAFFLSRSVVFPTLYSTPTDLYSSDFTEKWIYKQLDSFVVEFILKWTVEFYREFPIILVREFLVGLHVFIVYISILMNTFPRILRSSFDLRGITLT